jgi:hypothetical protein
MVLFDRVGQGKRQLSGDGIGDHAQSSGLWKYQRWPSRSRAPYSRTP